MDPNEALARIREICDKFNAGEFTFGQAAAQMSTLIELIDGLHEWITKGGFLPNDWEPTRIVEITGRSLDALLNSLSGRQPTMLRVAILTPHDGKRPMAYKVGEGKWSAPFEQSDGATVKVLP